MLICDFCHKPQTALAMLPCAYDLVGEQNKTIIIYPIGVDAYRQVCKACLGLKE